MAEISGPFVRLELGEVVRTQSCSDPERDIERPDS
jgi:hypothetical protein